LKPFHTLVCVAARLPVGFFGYPGGPSLHSAPGAREVVLCRPEQDVLAALEALADELGAPPAAIPARGPRPEPARGAPTPEGLARTVAALIPEGAIVADAVARARHAAPACLYALDPVMGDRGRVFVRPDVVDAIRALAPLADILFPNVFELGLLTGRPTGTLAEVRAAAGTLRAGGRPDRIVIVTSVPDSGRLGTLACDRDGDFIVRVPPIDHPAYGAGDSFAALFLARYLATRDVAGALSMATSSVHA
jgi:hypothetical protein